MHLHRNSFNLALGGTEFSLKKSLFFSLLRQKRELEACKPQSQIFNKFLKIKETHLQPSIHPRGDDL
jgi:hypothetical protein